MKSVLLTAFEPYDRWHANSSWLTLVQLTQELPSRPTVTTRLYPVDFSAMRQRLEDDLKANYDVALHLGQSPGSGRVCLEAIGLNIGGQLGQTPEEFEPLVAEGPVAYRSELPLANWAGKLRSAGIPAAVSYHAGTYLCNATMYWSHHLAKQQGLSTRAAFLHLPLDPSQTAKEPGNLAALPVVLSAAAVRLILNEIECRL